jgi:hypothetical protein
MKSKYSVILIFVFLFGIFFSFGLWKKSRLIIDAPSYYAYLPAVFIYHDLHLTFTDKDPAYFKDKLWYYTIENGNRLIKHPMGISVALTPFFLLGHLIAKLTDATADGYSMIYQNFVSIGVLFYLFIGLFYLRRVLLRFFSDNITAVTLFSIVLGTNLLWYSSFEGLMSHSISFSFFCICLFVFFKWLDSGDKKQLFFFAIVFGLSILIRPLAVTAILYFIIFGIISKGGFQSLVEFIRLHLKSLLYAILIICLIFSLQLIYWKYITGSWLYDAYSGEHFVFDKPEILAFLVGFRKGVFIYTPVLVFAVIGLIHIRKRDPSIFYATIVLLSVTIFVLASWWNWSYGICWGIRPIIDYYSFLSIPLAAGFEAVFSGNKISSFISRILIVLLISLNLFQTWQYKNGLIHYDDMSKEAYQYGFCQTKLSREWQDLLKPYDWERRLKGLPQIEYSRSYFEESFKTKRIYLRGFNLQFVSMNEKAQNAIAAYQKEVSDNSFFRIVPMNGDTVTIIASNGNFLSVSKKFDNILIASPTILPFPEKFQLIYLKNNDNLVAIKCLNNRYITVSGIFPNLLYGTSKKIGQKETFRLFVKENQ